jgi:osmoprotectant transport system permease protein
MELFGQVVAWFTDPAQWSGPSGIPTRLVEHIGLSALAVGVATVLAMPWALWAGHTGRGQTVAVNVTNVGRAIPTFAVLSLLALTPLGLSTTSTVVALVLFAIPPILTTTVVGIRGVDPDIREAARGMGLDGRRALWDVEVPLAMPMIMSGLRLASVQVIATATLAALVGGGGLGRFITAGLGRQDNAQVVGGALLVALLALVVELVFERLERMVDPRRRPASQVPTGEVAQPSRSAS